MTLALRMASSTAAVVDITDLIGMGGFYAADMADALTRAKGAKDITVRLTSDGGDITQGLSIYSMLNGHAARVRVEVLGVAASMGSVIAMAGDTIAMAEDAYMMIHNPASGVDGESGDMRERADLLDSMRDTIAKIYQRRTGQKLEDILAAMTAETWMTAQQALALGYCTEIIPAKKMAARVRRFAKTPACLRASKNRNQQMDLTELYQLLGLPDDSTYEDAIAAIKVLQTAAAGDGGDSPDDPANADKEPDGDESPEADPKKAAVARRQVAAALAANKGNAVLAAIKALGAKIDTVAARVDGDERSRLIAANIKKFNPKTEKQARSWPIAQLRAFVRDADDISEGDDEQIDTTPRGASRVTSTAKEIVLTAAQLNTCKVTGTKPADLLAHLKKQAEITAQKAAH